MRVSSQGDRLDEGLDDWELVRTEVVRELLLSPTTQQWRHADDDGFETRW